MVLLIVGGAALAASLLLLYLLALRFPKFGDSLAFLCILVMRLLVKIQWLFEQAGTYCYQVFEKSLKYPPSVTDEVWLGMGVLARQVWLFLASCVLFGETDNALLASPALFQVPNDVTLPGGVSIASSLLFLAVPALFGAVVLECAEVIPYAVGLFPRLKPKIKKVLGIACLVGFILSMLVLVLFWIYRGLYISFDPDTANVLSPFILGGLGLSVAGASVLALWAFVVGLIGWASVVLWLAAALCNGFAALFSLLPTVVDVAVVHLSGGERTVYERYLPGHPWQVPNTWFQNRVSPVSKDQNVLSASLPEGHTNERVFALSQYTENEVIAMSERVVCLTLNGVLGSRLLASVQASLSPVKQLIRSSGRVDTLSPIVAPVGLGVPVSPSALQRAHASSLTEQFDSMGNNILEAHSPVRDLPALHAHVLDCHTGADALQMLRDTKRRLPGITQVAVTALTSADLAHPSVQTFLSELARLHREGVIATTLLLSLSSPLVRSLGEDKFFRYVGRLLADLCACHTHSLNNLSAVALFDQLGKASPFVSLAIATAETVSGKTPLRGFWLKLFTKKAVTGNVQDMLAQALTVTKDVMTKPETQAWMQSISATLPCALLFDTPLSLADRRFHQFEERNNQQVKDYMPNASTLTISGSPVMPLRGSSSPFLVGVACLYPVTFPAVKQPQTAVREETETDGQKPISSVLPSDVVVADAHPRKPNGGAVNGHKAVRGRPRLSTKSRASTKKGK